VDPCPRPRVGLLSRDAELEGYLLGVGALTGQLGRTDARDVYVKPLEHGRVFHEAVDQPVIPRHGPGRYLDLLVVKRSVIYEEQTDSGELLTQFPSPASCSSIRSTTLLMASNSFQRATRTLLPSPLLTKIVGVPLTPSSMPKRMLALMTSA